ncbi:hypothetical protein M4951_13780 [Blastopirellula sp. J2-11]|uniref:hypothetical protein n=1 Tax=Blastopirellula sp. J2-11 TaxID=2943192 RepID=UPI0021C928EC|nr:hypothetical protein [Blastopirellula sp. J2-11]UUO04461.1 hypothetical protein M4951_13780 [Blastopirellula sp. J2-11]
MATGNEPQKSGGGASKILLGCLVVILLIFAVFCAGGVYLYMNAGTFVAQIAKSVGHQMIDETDLPEEQKVGMKEQIDRLADGYVDGDISQEQLEQIGTNISKSPVISAIPVIVVETLYIKKSGLSDEEKADAKKQLNRVAHGMFEDKITSEQLDPAMEKIATKDENGKWQMRNPLTDEELKSFVGEMKTIADENEIPDEDFNIDIVAEFKKAIDDALEK